MNDINRQVHRAKRRIMIGKFFRILGWSLFSGLLLAAIGMAVPKIWAIRGLDAEPAMWNWNFAWIIGGVTLSFVTACTLTWISRASNIDAAMEVDKRFGLKERLSSALSLDARSAESPAGTALLEDANHRAQKIDVRDGFPFKPTWKALLPLFPALIVAALIFLPNAVQEAQAASIENEQDRKKEVRMVLEERKKKLIEKMNMLEEKGLKDAKLDFKNLGRKLDELDSESGDLKKEALVKLNEIKKSVEEGKKQFGDAAEMKKEFNKLNSLEQGPARKLSEALSEGNFEEAKKSIRDLAQKLRDGELNDVEKRQLARNLQDMAEQVQDLAKRHEERKQELQERIQQAKQEGDLDKAAEMQEKLEQLKEKDKKVERMNQIANKLQKAGEAMQRQQQKKQQQQQGNKQKQNQQQNQQGNKQQQGQGNKQQGNQKQQGQKQGQKPGQQQGQKQGQKPGQQQGQQQGQKPGQQGQPKNGQPGEQQGQDQTQQGGNQPTDSETKAAQQALEDLAEEMDDLQSDLDALEDLKDLEDDLQASKDMMNGCEGDGMPEMGNDGKESWNDWGRGEGRGGGKRERDESGKIGSYRSRVKGKIQRGETVVTGTADGENIPGQSITEARADIQAAILGDTDPLEDQKLPRAQREHAKQYFDKLRGK